MSTKFHNLLLKMLYHIALYLEKNNSLKLCKSCDILEIKCLFCYEITAFSNLEILPNYKLVHNLNYDVRN